MGHAPFRSFRWTPDYSPKSESKFASVWVRLTGLPLTLYDSSIIAAIVSSFGYFMVVDDRTKACVSLKYARVCVELDVTQPIPDAVWISLLDNKGYWKNVEMETNLAYCSKCHLHGHSLASCRKAKRKQTHGVQPAPVNPVEVKPVRPAITKPAIEPLDQWVPVRNKKAKKTGDKVSQE